MKYNHIALLGLLALIFVASCSPKAEQSDHEGDPKGEHDAMIDSLNAEEEPLLVDPEVFPPKTFGYYGMDFIKIGDSVTWAELQVDAPVKDTLFTAMGTDESGAEMEYAWSARRVEFADGNVLLEADFKENHFLNRIQIETSEYRHHTTGLGVGSTVAEMVKAYPDLTPRPFPEYGVIELIPNNHNIYHIPMDDKIDPTNPDTWEMSRLDPQAQVVRVVVM